jgi:hypothetical protein
MFEKARAPTFRQVPLDVLSQKTELSYKELELLTALFVNRAAAEKKLAAAVQKSNSHQLSRLETAGSNMQVDRMNCVHI